MDGVLIDSEVVYMNRLRWFVRDFLGKQVPEERLLTMVGATGNGHFEAVREYCPPDWDIEVFRSHYREFGKDKPIDYPGILFPDALPALEWLKGHGYRTVLATSTVREKAEEIKALCGFGAYMEFVLCGDMFRESKPNPEIYLRCQELLKLPRGEMPGGGGLALWHRGRGPGGIPVAVRRERRFPVDQRGADWYIDSLAELPGFLTGGLK